MKFFPETALTQLEFDKIKVLLTAHCQAAYAKEKAMGLRIHTRLEYMEPELKQSHEYKLLLQNGMFFPSEVFNLANELQLLGIPGAVLTGDQLVDIRKLAENAKDIFNWFNEERALAFPFLHHVITGCYFEKATIQLIDEIVDDAGNVRDSASKELSEIRINLGRTRAELRRIFDRVVSKWKKNGYVSEIEESFLNGRRVGAVHAEYKRQVKGILLGESDTRKTAFVEPEETIELNNDVFALEHEESREIYRILKQLTETLAAYTPLLKQYHVIAGEYDFIKAKAKLGLDMEGNYPVVQDKAEINIFQAYHPLLYLYNKKAGKPTVPVSIALNEKNRILVISGPNAGGKTVTLKTIGLLQLMLQSGLLVPVHPDSAMGVFSKLMIDIGDTQSIEFDLSTYSSHLKNMKHFIENANGRTLFFIDELGGGSDPHLGGAFAEVILEELARKRAFGIVTTHYLNLKIMAGKTPGIINGAMAFDEKQLLPLYKLIVGKPGSSYTFSIAERIGLQAHLIERARKLVDEGHFRLDKLLNRAEQDVHKLEKKEKELHALLKENERLKKEMEQFIEKERHRQQVELLKHQNKISEERIAYLKDMERKLKQIVFDWRRAEGQENKTALMKQMHALLFKQKEKQVTEKKQKKFDARYVETGEEIRPGVKVKMLQNNQVGVVKELRDKKVIVQLGAIPLTVDLKNVVAVQERATEAKIL
ncbi:MAG: DNA mismatch repair protein MutS [Chitinophagaceae bacterium]|nr:DNA mismatch repair protein MutS [Chitinophagaceae bacterium]MCW5927534.1 DNA mismatch repair protein MutS [Chitinophagaceae bacterium]